MITYILIGIIGVLLAVYFGTHTPQRQIRKHIFIKLLDNDDTLVSVYHCHKQKCEGCVLRFRCGTQREAIQLSWNQWLQLEPRLKHLRKPRSIFPKLNKNRKEM